MRKSIYAFTALAIILSAPAHARDSLGIFSDWGAFRDPAVPRCYAIAKPRPSTLSRDYDPFTTIGSWPSRNVRRQVHFRLSREMAKNTRITLRMIGKSFDLAGGGGDAWAKDPAMDAAIVAAIRSAGSMTIGARDKSGRRFSNTYDLSGAATAMDAASVGCARLK